nr:hypothetical protein WCOTENJF_WCOTENJF_CDS_0021 [uncultured phage]
MEFNKQERYMIRKFTGGDYRFSSKIYKKIDGDKLSKSIIIYTISRPYITLNLENELRKILISKLNPVIGKNNFIVSNSKHNTEILLLLERDSKDIMEIIKSVSQDFKPYSESEMEYYKELLSEENQNKAI